GKGLFVAVGDAGTVVYSEDGVEWTATDTGVTTLGVRDVVYGMDKFVAVGPGLSATNVGRAYWSVDGKSWGNTANPLFVHLNGVAASDETFVAAGIGKSVSDKSLNVHISPDGTSWAPR